MTAKKTHTELAFRTRLKLPRQCENPVNVSESSARKPHYSKCGSVWAELTKRGRKTVGVRCYHCHAKIERKQRKAQVKRAA